MAALERMGMLDMEAVKDAVGEPLAS